MERQMPAPELLEAARKAASWLRAFAPQLGCAPDGPAIQDLAELEAAIERASTKRDETRP